MTDEIPNRPEAISALPTALSYGLASTAEVVLERHEG